VTRAALTLVVLAAIAASPAAASYTTHVPVSLTQIPGNVCCPKEKRASVSASGVMTTSTRSSGGTWKRVARRHLSRVELGRLRADLRRFNPATLKPPTSAGCNGPPIGDVGATVLRIGTHQSSCPPKSAKALVSLLRGWLPS